MCVRMCAHARMCACMRAKLSMRAHVCLRACIISVSCWRSEYMQMHRCTAMKVSRLCMLRSFIDLHISWQQMA